MFHTQRTVRAASRGSGTSPLQAGGEPVSNFSRPEGGRSSGRVCWPVNLSRKAPEVGLGLPGPLESLDKKN